jgi:gliding motility-associated-like protein
MYTRSNMTQLFTRILLIIGLVPILSFGQNPGNIGVGNLTGWFKPDALPLGNVTAWTTTLSTIGPVTVTDAAAPYPQATNTPAGNVSNYNTTIYYNGNTLAALQALTNTSSLNFMQNNSGATNNGTFFCAYYFPPSLVNNNHMLLWNNTPNAIQFRNLGAAGRIAIGLSPSNSSNACRDWTENNLPTIISLRGNRSSTTSLNTFENDLLTTTNPASQSSGPTGIYMGVQPGNGNSPYNGYIHEYIFYNTNLTAVQMRRVHTYLAIKYGITLDDAGGGVQGDYESSIGSLLWDANAPSAFHNEVIGIGLDSAQALMQKQSHTFDDSYRLYIGATLAANNANNTGVFNNDNSFIMMGNNTDGACAASGPNLEVPIGINTRFAKEWKVTNTNFDQIFNWDIKVDTCELPGSLVGPINPTDFHLLYDTDGNFIDASIAQTGTGTLSFSYSNGYVTVSGIDTSIIPVNSTRFLTLGFNASEITLSSDTSICDGDSVQLTVNINLPGLNNVSYTNGIDTTALDNISDGYTFYVTPSATTTYSILGQANFLNCCSLSSSSSATVIVNSQPVITANVSQNPLCLGDSTQLIGGGALTYAWDNGVTNGNYVSPIVNTTYQVTGTDINGCVDSNTVTINVTNNPVVGATANSNIMCFGDSVLLNGTGATTYVWNNGAIDNAYISPAVTTTYIVSGSIGSCTDTASILITVNQLPNVQANVTDNLICLNDSTALFGSGAVTYLWDNGVVDNVYFFPTTTVLYTATGTDANNCENTDTITVVVNALPTVVANATSTVLCEGDSTQLTGSGANTYVWDNGVMDGDWAIPLTTITHELIGTDVNGCADTTTISITVNPNPVVTITASTAVLCIGDPVTLSGNGANTYVWYNGVTANVAFNPTITNTYFVTGTNGFGCIDTTSIQVIINNLPNVTANTSSLGVCEGDPLTLNGGGAQSYIWDNTVTDGLTFIPTVAALYAVTGTDANGCMNTASVFVDFYPAFPLSLGPDTVVCPQEPIALVANDIFSFYQWSNGSNFPSITINTDGVYTLTVNDINGCVYTDDINVELAEDCFVTLFIPNAFTPNNDEHNRYFRTTGSYIKFFHMEIYDRWGELVYVTDDIDAHWDGTYGGKICPQGLYSYVVKYAHDLNTDEKLTASGHINLLR